MLTPFLHGPSTTSELTDDTLPLYHPGLLEVKFRTDQGPVAAAMAMGGRPMLTRSIAATNYGLGTLMSFERSGLIRRVFPLSEDAPVTASFSETPLLAAFSAASAPEVAADPNSGVSIVELYDDADVGTLQTELAQDPSVEMVSRVPVRYLLAKKGTTPPAPAANPPASMWNLAKIRWHQARSKPGFVDAQKIKVAVLDTGIDDQHPDLKGVIAGYEYLHPQNPQASSKRDIIGHGTHVAGTIAAGINNSVGINGICRCQLWAMKIFDDLPDWYQGAGYFAYFVDHAMYMRALSRCLTLNVGVVNLSIGGRGAPSSQEKHLFSALIQNNTVVVAAMGNESSSIQSYPAAIPRVIAVGATRIDDRRASFSNYGPHISLTAPGEAIWSTLPTYPGNQGYYPRPTFPPTPDLTRPIIRDTDYAAWNGTSMASPHVAAAAALLKARHPNYTVAQVRQKLEQTAHKVPAMMGQNFSHEYGFGRLDLERLLS